MGIINGGAAKSYSLDLAFLGRVEYAGVQLADAPQRPDDFVRTDVVVRGGTTLTVSMTAGGGFVAMFEPVKK